MGRTKAKQMSQASLDDAAELLRLLGHATRLRIVELLLTHRYCVGELADACEVPRNVASEHLRLMQRCGLLRGEREGRQTYYRIVDPNLAHLLECLRSRCAAQK